MRARRSLAVKSINEPRNEEMTEEELALHLDEHAARLAALLQRRRLAPVYTPAEDYDLTQALMQVVQETRPIGT